MAPGKGAHYHLREAIWDEDEKLCVGGHLIKSVRFADSQATIASLVEGLQNMTARTNDNAESFGMKINIKRTQAMEISKSPREEFTIILGGKELARVKQFTYLGSIITQASDCGRGIRTRIASGKDAFSARKELLTKSFSLTLRKCLVKSSVWSTLFYGAETWVIRKEDARRLESCDMWLRQKLIGILWADKVCKKEVLTRVGERQQVLDIIRNRQRRWIGHTLRHGDLLTITMEGRIQGKRPPGQRRIGLLDSAKNGKDYANLKCAMNRRL